MPDKQESIIDEKLAGFSSRLQLLMKRYSIASFNEMAIKHLGWKASEKLNRLKTPGKKPSAEIVADILNKWPEINGNWLLLGDGEMLVADGERDVATSNKIEPATSRKISLETLSEDLQSLKEGQAATLANVRAFGEYQVTREFPDRDAREQIMEQINKIVALNLGAIAKANTRAGGGN